MRRYGVLVALAGVAIAEKLLISQPSITAAINRLAHGGVASAVRVSTSPRLMGPESASLPRLQPYATIVREKRGAADCDSERKNRLHAIRLE